MTEQSADRHKPWDWLTAETSYDADGNPDPNGVYLRSGARMTAEQMSHFARRREAARTMSDAVPDIPASRYDVCVCGRPRLLHGHGTAGPDRRGLHLPADEWGAECERTPEGIEVKERYVPGTTSTTATQEAR